MNLEFYKTNRERLISQMEDDSIGIIFSGNTIHRSADSFYGFLVNRNFYYLTGLDQEDIILVIKKYRGKIEEELFIAKADPYLEKWVGRVYSKEEAKKISGLEKLSWNRDFYISLIKMLNEYEYKNIYLDLEKTGQNTENRKALDFSQEIIQDFPYLDIKSFYPIIRDLRTIKRTGEIKKIRKAIEITSKGIESILKAMEDGLREYQLEAYFNFTINLEGARDNAFETIVASGKNATILHYVENKDIIKDGDLVLFDLGADWDHYCADISRTFPVGGRFTPRQKTLYEIVLKAQEAVIRAIKPGIHYPELNNIAKEVLTKECMDIGLIDRPDEISKYYYHGVSHYLGMDTHDIGNRDRLLEAGMVIAVEPGLYIEEEGIGIRIEDDILVTEDGCEVLSKAIPKTVEEIEGMMSR